jgi:hypothetical protein
MKNTRKLKKKSKKKGGEVSDDYRKCKSQMDIIIEEKKQCNTKLSKVINDMEQIENNIQKNTITNNEYKIYIEEYKKDFDYSDINITTFNSYAGKIYKSLDEILKNVFITSRHYETKKFENNPNDFYKNFKNNEKICIYKWFVIRTGGNNYNKIELLITTYGRVLLNISAMGMDMPETTSLTTMKEFNFWLSKHSINILNLMLNFKDEVMQGNGYINALEDNIFTKNIFSVIEKLRYIERHNDYFQYLLNNNIQLINNNKNIINNALSLNDVKK